MTKNISNKILLSDLTNQQRALALKRYRLIEPYIKKEIQLNTLCEKANIPLRTAGRWTYLYKTYGLSALVRKPRKDKEQPRVAKTEIIQLIEGMHLKSPHLSFASVYRTIQTYCKQNNFSYPKYRTVCTILSRLPKSMKTLAHKGASHYSRTFDLICLREASQPNEVWQADHCKLDILLLNHKETPQRPWLTIVFDDHSRAIAGYKLSFMNPCSMKTALALRKAIWRKTEPTWTICGIPQALYIDHGTDFTSAHIEQVCIDLKINLIFSKIGQPQGRGKIERFFLTLNQMLLCNLPVYTKQSVVTPKLTLAQLEERLREFIIQYNQNEHSQTGIAPKVRWEHNGFLPQMPEDIDQLDLLLMTLTKTRKVMRDGIHFQGLRYMDLLLADYIGENVVIRYDPSDITSIRVFYKNKFLCQPICPYLEQQTIGIKDIQAARNARKKDLKIHIKQRLSLVDALLTTKSLPDKPSIVAPMPQSKTKLKLYASDA